MIPDIVIAFVGYKEVNADEAFGLLDDLVQEDSVEILISNDENNDALGIIDDWASSRTIPVKLYPDDVIIDAIIAYENSDLMLIVLGTEKVEDTIQEAMAHDVDVSDLSRALWTVGAEDITEVSLAGPVALAETVSGESGGTGWPGNSGAYDRSERRTWTRQEIEEIVTGIIAVSRDNGRQVIREGVAPTDNLFEKGVGVTDMPVESTDNPDGEILCYRNSRSGMTRVAGRGKKKPNDEEVYLTQAEVDAL